MRQRIYLRRAIGIVIGFVLAIALSDGGWHVAGGWFPPTGALIDSFGVIDEAPSLARMPLPGKMIIALGWFIAVVAGAFAALRVAQWRPAGWIVAVPVVVMNLLMGWSVAAPIWLLVAAIVAPLLGCWLAERHFHRARPGDPLIN